MTMSMISILLLCQDNERLKLWYKRDVTFLTPRASAFFAVTALPVGSSSFLLAVRHRHHHQKNIKTSSQNSIIADVSNVNLIIRITITYLNHHHSEKLCQLCLYLLPSSPLSIIAFVQVGSSPEAAVLTELCLKHLEDNLTEMSYQVLPPHVFMY